jgi:Uncharacterized protein conserved in bacteria
MKRFYYTSDSLDGLSEVEHELEIAGITKPQIHVFSRDDAGVEQHELHTVQEFMKRDVLHSGLWGAVVGLAIASLVMIAVNLSGIGADFGWAPFIIPAILVLIFCTWEGGLFGIHKTHHDLRNFESALRDGKHILFVDVETKERSLLQNIQLRHPHLKPAGEGPSTPSWAISCQKKWHDFVQAMP